MDLKELRKMTVVKLREEALNHTQITGVHGLTKQQLIEALAQALGIPMEKQKKVAKTSDISSAKQKIRNFRKLRDEEMAKKSKGEMSKIRKQIKRLKRHTRNIPKSA